MNSLAAPFPILCTALLAAGAQLAPEANAAAVFYNFDDHPSLAGYRSASPPGSALPAGALFPDADPGGSGFTASFGATAPAGTFGLLPPPPQAFMDLYFPNARSSGYVLGELIAYDTAAYSLTVTTSMSFSVFEFDWASFAGVMTNSYIVVDDGLGHTATYFDDGTMTYAYDDGFGVTYNGNAAGHARYESQQAINSLTITAYGPRGETMAVQALNLDNVSFTVVPEPSVPLGLGALVIASLLPRRRR